MTMQETKSRRQMKDVDAPPPNGAETVETGERKFREVDSRFVILSDKSEKNHQKSVEGAIVAVDFQVFPPTSENGKPQTVGRYKLIDENGIQWTVLGSTALDDRLGFRVETDDNGNRSAMVTAVEMGSYLRLSYLGTIRSGNKREVKQYKVEVAEA